MTLPVHPQPFANESMTSWLARLANANYTSIPSILSSYAGDNKRWDRVDLDLLERREAEIIADMAYLKDMTRLQTMTLSNYSKILFRGSKADRKSWMSSTFTTRYCPLCLAKDRIPHLRTLWRLHFLPICIDHKIILQNGCWKNKCNFSQPLVTFNQKGCCSKCSTPFCNAPISRAEKCERLVRFASAVESMLRTSQLPHKTSFPYGMSEFFEVLLFFVRYFNQYLPRERSWEDLIRSYSLPLNSPYEWRGNNAVACILIENSLEVIEKWSTTGKNLVTQHRSRLNRLHYDSGIRIPTILKLLMGSNIVKEKQYKLSSRSKIQVPRIDSIEASSCEEKVKYAIECLVRANRRPYIKTVSRLSGISYKRLKKRKVLCALIQAEKNKFCMKQEQDITDAITVLHSRGIPITITTVATYLGKSYWYIKKSHMKTFNSVVQSNLEI